MRIQRKSVAAGVMVATAVLLAGCTGASGGSSGSGGGEKPNGPVSPAANGDIKDHCGTAPIKVGYLKSNGGGTAWTAQALAEFKDEASKCPNIKDVQYAEGVNNQAKAISDLNSFVAQGVDAMIMTPDYGAAQLPSMKQAMGARTTLVSIWDSTGGEPGKDASAMLDYDYEAMGAGWAKFLHEQLPDGGKVAFLGGTAANTSTQPLFDAFQKAVHQYPNLEIVGDKWQVTDWDPAKSKQVMTGLLSQHERIDAVISDYVAIGQGVLQSYDDAGFKRPVLAGQTPNNQMGCVWQDKPFPYMVYGDTSSIVRAGLRLAVGIHNGTTDEGGTRQKFLLPDFTYQPNGEQAPCDKSLPPDADLTAGLSKEQMAGIFG
jgi:ribose transport system substrate-binding protein